MTSRNMDQYVRSVSQFLETHIANLRTKFPKSDKVLTEVIGLVFLTAHYAKEAMMTMLGIFANANALGAQQEHPIRCFLQLAVDEGNGKTENLGRVVVELESEKLPKTCENFRVFCKGWTQNVTGDTLSYRGSQLFGVHSAEGRVVGGDVVNGNGTNGTTIYGPTMPTEGPSIGFAQPGTLALAHWGPGINSSQFFIVVEPQAHDAYPTNLAFGKVTEGLQVLTTIVSRYGTTSGIPTGKVIVKDCGQL